MDEKLKAVLGLGTTQNCPSIKGLRALGAMLIKEETPFPIDRTEQERVMVVVAERAPEFKEVLIRVASSLEKAASRASMREFGFAGAWASEGYPVFKLTRDLVAALALTEHSGSMKDVKMPFRSILIDPTDCPLFIQGKSITSILVNHFDDDDNGKGHLFIEARMMGTGQGKEATAIWSMVRPYGQDISGEEWLKRDRREEGDLFSKKKEVDKTPDGMSAGAVRRLVMNLCIYIQMKKEAGLLKKAPSSTVRFKKDKRKGKISTIFKMGSEIHLPKELIDAASNYSASSTRWKVDKRFITRGHWRNQPCGPNRSERKRIFIQAHWKGPTAAEAVERLYKVETFEEAGFNDA